MSVSENLTCVTGMKKAEQDRASKTSTAVREHSCKRLQVSEAKLNELQDLSCRQAPAQGVSSTWVLLIAGSDNCKGRSNGSEARGSDWPRSSEGLCWAPHENKEGSGFFYGVGFFWGFC